MCSDSACLASILHSSFLYECLPGIHPTGGGADNVLLSEGRSSNYGTRRWIFVVNRLSFIVCRLFVVVSIYIKSSLALNYPWTSLKEKYLLDE